MRLKEKTSYTLERRATSGHLDYYDDCIEEVEAHSVVHDSLGYLGNRGMSLMMTAVEEASFRFQTSLNKSLDDNSAIAGPSED